MRSPLRLTFALLALALPAAAGGPVQGLALSGPTFPSPAVHYGAALQIAESAAQVIGVAPGGLSFHSVTGSIPRQGPMHYNFAAVDAAGTSYRLVSVAVDQNSLKPSVYPQPLSLSELERPAPRPGQPRAIFLLTPAAGLELPPGLLTPEQALSHPYQGTRFGMYWRSSFSLGFAPGGRLNVAFDGEEGKDAPRIILPASKERALVYTFFDEKGNVAVYDPKLQFIQMRVPNPRYKNFPPGLSR